MMMSLISPWESPGIRPQSFDGGFRYCLVATPLNEGTFSSVVICQVKSSRVLTHFTQDGTSFELHSPIIVDIVKEEDDIAAENEELAIFTGGGTEAEALDEFQATLVASWDGLRDAIEADLTPDALALRKKLSQHFLGA